MTYGDCTYCGGSVEERQVRMDYRHHGQLFIMENVPVGVCKQCGEKFLTSEMAKKLEAATEGPDKQFKTIAVPVISIAA